MFGNACDGAYSSVNVRFTKDCDNNCAFCVERNGLSSLGRPNPEKITQAIIDSGIKDVLILGGEPFLYVDELLTCCRLIRPHVDAIRITTALPKIFSTHIDPRLEEIFSLIDGLNVSIHSIVHDENMRAFGAKFQHDRLDCIEELNRFIPMKVRVSLTLSKGAIDSRGALVDAVAVLLRIGCMSIKINELQNAPDHYVSYERIMEIRMPSPYAYGCQTQVTHFDHVAFNPCTIIVKRSCFLVEPSANPTIMDVVKCARKRWFKCPKNAFAVVYEDGSSCNRWLQMSKG